LGSLQALLALKILLGLPGQLAGELLLLDFTTFDTSRLKSPRRRECQAPGCALIEGVSPEEPDLEVAVGSLEEAGRSFEVIDIRSREEVTARPTGTRHIAMAELLAKPELLADRGVSAGPAAPPHADRPARPADSGYLLLCATGRRSLATARELRKLGLPVHSLAGGLDRIAASLAARGMEHVDHE
jgi:rhodanese-related sulfurtransferase